MGSGYAVFLPQSVALFFLTVNLQVMSLMLILPKIQGLFYVAAPGCLRYKKAIRNDCIFYS